MTDRDKRLQSFLMGDLEDAQKALTLTIASDKLEGYEKNHLENARDIVRLVIDELTERSLARLP